MFTLEEFRGGQVSVPAMDAEAVPECCFSCPCLAYKEFSVGDGLYYYYCGYSWRDETDRRHPACLPLRSC